MFKEIEIIQMNDTHANLLPLEDIIYGPRGFKISKRGGYAKIMSKINYYREKNKNLLVFDNGDTIHGTYEAFVTKGENMVPYLNALGINAMTFHWDAAYTPQHLQALEAKLNYPILAANVYREGTEELLFEATKVFEVDGIRIGVIGIASNIIRSNMPKPFWIDTEFTDGIEETRRNISELKSKGVDLVMVLSHLGYPQDIELIKQVDGIDIYLSGHTHNRIRELVKINDTYIIQSGALGTSIGYLNLKFKDKELLQVEHEFIELDETVKDDETIVNMLINDPVLKQHKDYLDQIVGETAIDLHRGSTFFGTMDYLLLDSMRDATGLDIAFSNGWRYGGAVKKGKIIRRNLYQIVPMNPEIMTVELTGRDLFVLLEDNLENTFSCEPFQQKGGYIKRNSGLKIYFKLENPKGQKIQRVFVGDEELNLNKIYKAAYVTRQAVPENYGENHKAFGMKAVEAIENYLSKRVYNRDNLETYIPV